MLDNNQIKVVNGDSKKKSVVVKNIEPISNIQIIRDQSDFGSSESESDSDSELSEISKYNDSKKKSNKNNHSKNTSKNNHSKSTFKSIPQYHQRERNVDYSAFSNPKKISQNFVPDDESGSEYSSISDSDSGSEMSEYSNNNTEKDTYQDTQKLKQDLLIKIQSLEKKGFEFSKKFNMTSNYEDMMFEYEKVKRFIESQAAIKFSRRCLMACVTGLEFVNKKFDPFSVKLEGWSENVMENVDDYDNIFERLHEK